MGREAAGYQSDLCCASALSAGVLLCAASAHADDRAISLNLFRPISPPKSVRYASSNSSAPPARQLKQQEEAISARKLRETQNTLAQLNKQIDEMNADCQTGAPARCQERNLAAQLDAVSVRVNTHAKLILSGEESQRGSAFAGLFGYLNQARQETIAQLKQTREEVTTQKPSWKRAEPAANAALRSAGAAGEA
jgi:septal ring factor EnvC (AmiA/AmiB activator)